jgi:hypothetical protein
MKRLTALVLSCALALQAPAAVLINPYRFATVGGGSNFTADLRLPFEFATPANQAAWDAALEGDDNSALLWAVSSDVTLLSTTASGERATVSTFNSTSDTGSLGFARAYSSNLVNHIEVNTGADKTAASFGMWFKYSGTPTITKIFFRVFNAVGNDVIVVRLVPSTRYVQIDGTTTATNGTALTVDTFYWVTCQANRNGTSYLSVYDTAGALVGSTASVTTANNAIRRVSLFDYNAPGLDTGVTLYLDDFVYDGTSATFPLGP